MHKPAHKRPASVPAILAGALSRLWVALRIDAIRHGIGARNIAPALGAIAPAFPLGIHGIRTLASSRAWLAIAPIAPLVALACSLGGERGRLLCFAPSRSLWGARGLRGALPIGANAYQASLALVRLSSRLSQACHYAPPVFTGRLCGIHLAIATSRAPALIRGERPRIETHSAPRSSGALASRLPYLQG